MNKELPSSVKNDTYDITIKTKKLPKGMTDSEWQIHFEEIKKQVHPSRFRYLYYPKYREQDGRYCGETLYQTYCNFINDILSVIRCGKIDYCFYVYQIAELLKHEPKLKSKWVPQDECFQVWIDKRR